MYVAVKGGERAIDNAHAWLAEERRGDPSVPELSVAQIREQMKLAVNRVMAEGSLYDPDLAALAIKQARGDLIEAVFLIRAYRTTLPRLASSRPVDTAAMAVDRRISATFKDLPGGQVLGPTFDYTHRLLDFTLMAEGEPPAAAALPLVAAVSPQRDGGDCDPASRVPHVTGFLNRDGLIEDAAPEDSPPPDLTREPLELPAGRPLRLQAITRGDEGFILSLAYSTQRGYGRTHAFVGELRIGHVGVEVEIPELGFAVEIGDVELTECETVNQFKGSKNRAGAVYARLWSCLWPVRAQVHRDELGRPQPALAGTGRGRYRRAGAGRGIRALPLRQHPGDGLSRTYKAARTTSISRVSWNWCASCAPRRGQ
jgi:alpha-D-ribose 1-methylphosphonate 5-triphosphate synthase subunit PhnI